MARLKPIRITKNDRDEYAKLARNTKAKISRTVKKYGREGEKLVQDIQVPDLSDFKTRSDYNAWKKKASSFTNRNNLHYQFVKNEYGVVATKAQLHKIERQNKLAQRNADKRAKEMEKKPYYAQGKQVMTQAEARWMFKQPDRAMSGYNRPKDFNFKDVRSQSRLKTIEESREKQADPRFYTKQTENMQKQFIENLNERYGNMANDLAKNIDSISPDVFLELYNLIEEFNFEFFYTDEIEEVPFRLQVLNRYIYQYKRGEIDLELKGIGGRK